MRPFICLILTVSLFLGAFPLTGPAWAWSPKDFKVIGYYSELLFDDPVDEVLQFDKLTHVIYAFLIPRADGSLVPIAKPERLKEIVRKAHGKGTKVCIAVGGWSYENIPLDSTFETLANDPVSRQRLVENILNFVDTYNLDGVELDWEYPNIGQSARNYESLVLALDKGLTNRKLDLTAAVNGAYSRNQKMELAYAVSQNCLKAFDWISVMGYDANNGNHSPYWFAETSIDYWVTHGVPKEKIVLGIPLYARPSWMQYRHLVAANRDNAWKDYAPGTPLGSWYNGITTVRQKTRLALRNAGGIMFFDINEDTTDETSLLGTAHQVILDAFGREEAEFRRQVTCVIQGRELSFTQEEGLGIPFIDANSRVMIPVRKPLETIGAAVTYDSESGTITAVHGDNTLLLRMGSNTLEVNGSPVLMDTVPLNVEGRVYIPARYVFEGFGLKVEWQGSSGSILMH